MKTIYLVRHCKAEGQEPSAELTSLGIEQSKGLTHFFSDHNIDVIVSSPFVRAYNTVKPLAEQKGLTIALEERLSERILSAKEHPDWLAMLEKTFSDFELAYEGGESSQEALDRGLTAIRELLKQPFEKAVVVTHGNLMSLILHHYDNMFGFEEWKQLSNPDVFELIFDKSIPKINRIWSE